MDEPIAIIGLDSRFPGDGDTPENFYQFLLAGRSAQSAVPSDRYNAEAFWHPDGSRDGATRATGAHFLKGSISAFDAPFFSITPTEAASMDPQQRGMLECVYRALENAGVPLAKAAGSETGVFVGCMYSDYDRMTAKDLDMPSKYAALGTVASMLSNRVSWCFDLRGPSITIDTACSSSLVALHQACNSLKLRETTMSIVGGCNLIISPEFALLLDGAGVLGPDGKSYSFDHRANGYSRGEGFGVVVLKRVSDAIRDGDTIRAVIRNSGTNQDGRSAGITQPTRAAQAALIRQVYKRADLDPAVTRFFEAHGTGTAVGDPIEASAISEIFTPHRSPDQPLHVGALKSNIGHLEGAAGVAAVIKGVLTLESGVIPPNTWFEKKNPKILDEWNLAFPTAPLVWPQAGLRRMSINSFGVGGSNAHVVMDDALHFLLQHHGVATGVHRTVANPKLPPISRPARTKLVNGYTHTREDSGIAMMEALDSEHESTTNGDCAPIQNGCATPATKLTNGNHAVKVVSTETNGTNGTNGHVVEQLCSSPMAVTLPIAPALFVFSSYDEQGILRLLSSYSNYLEAKIPKLATTSDAHRLFQDVAYTLGCKRSKHAWRTPIIAESATALQEALRKPPSSTTRATSEPRLAFIFTGQGAQWARMGSELMTYPVFRDSMYAADHYLKDLGCPWSLTYELSKESSHSRINDAELSQPVCTAVQVALVDLLATWKIAPHAVAGHSSGEVAAAYAAGQISRESAWRIAYYRGKLSTRLARGSPESKSGMAAVGLDKAATQAAIERVCGGTDDDSLTIACMNSHDSQTVSGAVDKLDALVAMLQQEKSFARKLNVEIAYHSRYMSPVAEEYLRAIGTLVPPDSAPFGNPAYFSSLKGRSIASSDLQEPSYWVENLLSPVRFDEAVTAMLVQGGVASKSNGLVNGHSKTNGVHHHGTPPQITDFLEIGPHSALKGPLRSIATHTGDSGVGSAIRYHSMLRRHSDAVNTALEAAGSLFCSGYDLDITCVNSAATHVDDGTSYKPSMLIDLPGYPFNHSKEYWSESRISRNHRSRRFPRHELLGAPVSDWNPANAIWRNYIRLSENPWIEDHKVAGDLLYPAAGMFVMAIEASRQLADSTRSVSGFRFRDVSLHTALAVPRDDLGVESHFYLRPAEAGWSEFQLWTVEDGNWKEHCRGFVKTEYDDVNGIVDGPAHDKQPTQPKYPTRVHTDNLYRTLKAAGLDFGPSFQTLSGFRLGPGAHAAKTQISSRVANIPSKHIQPHLVHPSVLDGIFQANLAPIVLGDRRTRRAILPVAVKDLWVSSDRGATHDGYTMSMDIDRRRQDTDEVDTSFEAVHASQGVVLVSGSGLTFKTIPSTEGQESQEQFSRQSFHMEWKPDPTSLSEQQALELFGKNNDDLSVAHSALTKDCESLCLAYIREYLATLSLDDVPKMTDYHQRYVSWMRHVVEVNSDKDIFPEQDVTTTRAMQEKIVSAGGSPEGALITAVGRALPAMLSGTTDPLDIIFKDKLAENVYRHGLGSQRCYGQMNAYLDALAHKNPKMRVLEIGGGTGGATTSILETLAVKSGRRFGHYDFTDISPSFFEHAKETFKDKLQHMSFRVLNIERDPVEQGFEAEGYDLVVAANVLHATKKIDETLRNVRALLKPGGKLVVFELTNPAVLTGGFCFGVLSGWWLSEDADREWGPLMPAECWRKHLAASGFTGLDAVFNDNDDAAYQTASILVSSVPERSTSSAETARSLDTYIITDGCSEMQKSVGESIAAAMSAVGSSDGTVRIVNMAEVLNINLSQSMTIVLLELDFPFLRYLTWDVFPNLKHILGQSEAVVWLGQSEPNDVPIPEYALVSGLARVLRMERPEMKFVTASLPLDTATSTSTIAQMACSLIDRVASSDENTYRVTSSGIAQVPRLVDAPYLSSHIASSVATHGTDKGPIFDPQASYVIAGGLGGLGISVVRWMATRGAKNFILLSRRGPVQDGAKELLDDLKDLGIGVATPCCDVADETALGKAIGDCLSLMPPIKGCIQASMVLRDDRLENMKYDDWHTALRSKVETTANLAKSLQSCSLDFFLIMSSSVGLFGNPEQANYAAGNTYQDAFAHMLRAQGISAASLDLPVILDVGFVAEKPELLHSLRSAGWAFMEEEEFHATLEYYCKPCSNPLPVTQTQVAPRLWLPQETAAEGAENPRWASDPLFSHLHATEKKVHTPTGQSKETNYASLIAASTSPAVAQKHVLDALLAKLSRVLSVELSNLDPTKALFAYGVDSLVSVGLRAWFAKELKADMSVGEMSDQGSIATLAQIATAKSRLVPKKF